MSTIEENITAKLTAAKAELDLSEVLRTVTHAQAVTYIENNVTDLPSAKRILKLMVRVLIVLRDRHPELLD